jgi:hypothetical protein
MGCNSCQVLRVNGVRVHERGCPEAHKDECRECEWCGSSFSPENAGDRFCDNSCYLSFNNLPDPEDMDIPMDTEEETETETCCEE